MREFSPQPMSDNGWRMPCQLFGGCFQKQLSFVTPDSCAKEQADVAAMNALNQALK